MAALAVGPQMSGLAKMLNFRYPMFGGALPSRTHS